MPVNVINGRRIEVISLKYNLLVRLTRASSSKIFSHIQLAKKIVLLRSYKSVSIRFYFQCWFFFLLYSILPAFDKLYYDYESEIAGIHRLILFIFLSVCMVYAWVRDVKMRHGILSDLSLALFENLL